MADKNLSVQLLPEMDLSYKHNNHHHYHARGVQKIGSDLARSVYYVLVEDCTENLPELCIGTGKKPF